MFATGRTIAAVVVAAAGRDRISYQLRRLEHRGHKSAATSCDLWLDVGTGLPALNARRIRTVSPKTVTRASRRRSVAAFTLIELLVVVAIIALLIAILLPTLQRAKEDARGLKCGTNQRQLMTAARMYADEWSDYMPLPNWGWPRYHQGRYPRGWLFDPPKILRNPLRWKETDRRNGLLWNYLLSGELYRCPEHYKNFKYQNDSRRLTSYLMNGAVSGYPWPWEHAWDRVFHVTEYRPDAVIFWEPPDPEGLDEDEHPGGPYGEDWEDGSSSPDQGMTYRHGDGATFTFIDGHTEWWTLDEYRREEAIPIANPLWCSPMTEHGRWEGWDPPDP